MSVGFTEKYIIIFASSIVIPAKRESPFKWDDIQVTRVVENPLEKAETKSNYRHSAQWILFHRTKIARNDSLLLSSDEGKKCEGSTINNVISNATCYRPCISRIAR